MSKWGWQNLAKAQLNTLKQHSPLKQHYMQKNIPSSTFQATEKGFNLTIPVNICITIVLFQPLKNNSSAKKNLIVFVLQFSSSEYTEILQKVQNSPTPFTTEINPIRSQLQCLLQGKDLILMTGVVISYACTVE